MAVTTRLTDVFLGEYYAALEPEINPELTALLNSGILRRSAVFDDVANNGQGTGTLHGWNDLDPNEDPNASNSNPDDIGKVGKVTQKTMRCRTLYLNKAYGSADLTTELATSDPLQQVRNRFGTYWARRMQRYLTKTACGICAASIAKTGSDMVIVGDNAPDGHAFIDAAFTLGDHADSVASIAVHSRVMAALSKMQLIQYLKDADGRIIMRTYMGKPIFMDDSLVFDKAKGQFLTIFYGDGAFAYGEGTPHKATELQRKPDAGNGGGTETLWERKTLILHPAGYSWKGLEDVESSPMPDTYAVAGNWKREYDRKNIPLAFVISGADVPIHVPVTNPNTSTGGATNTSTGEGPSK